MASLTRRHEPKLRGKGRPFFQLARRLAELGGDFYSKGWALGTSGNFSAVVNDDPLRLAITPTGVDKSALTARQILEIDASGKVVRGSGRPSAEAKLHLTLVAALRVGAVLHTHSVWSTILSEAHADESGLNIEGYEMLKGLRGVESHEQGEWLPIVENSQDYDLMAEGIKQVSREHPNSHGFLVRRHGLYTWGCDLAEAKRHVEILEFLLEVLGRKAAIGY